MRKAGIRTFQSNLLHFSMDINFQAILNLEQKIIEEIREDNGASVSFNYSETQTGKTVQVFTFNPTSKEHFLMHSANATTAEEALQDILRYVKTHKKNYSSFSVTWSRKGDNRTSLSYFYCNDISEVLEKFYAGKDKSMYVIYSVIMNPES
jgi:hypothetical protein